MKSDELSRLAELWSGDAQFRAEVRRDPEGALAAHGIQLNEEERATLRSIDMAQLSDEQLEERVSRITAPC